MLTRMESSAVVFNHTGFTVRAMPCGEAWRGQLLDQNGRVQDEFAYTREAFPGAVIGALTFTDLEFTVRLAASMWLHTDP